MKPLAFLALSALMVSLAGAGGLDAAVGPDQVVVPLKIIKGTDAQKFLQVYTVPVQCGAISADFTWGCFGATQISQSFAKKCDLKVLPSEELGDNFAGHATMTIRFADQDYTVDASVMKDAVCQLSERNGVIGLDVARRHQWTIDPEHNSLTLCPLGGPPASPPVATFDLSEDDGLSLKVKVRNEWADVDLMPSSCFIQADPDLQRLWDLGGIVAEDKDALKVYGDVKIMTIHGRDQLQIAPDFIEQEVKMALVGDPKHPEDAPFAQSCLGQSLLNRWVYTVDAQQDKLYVLKRLTTPTTRPKPATKP